MVINLGVEAGIERIQALRRVGIQAEGPACGHGILGTVWTVRTHGQRAGLEDGWTGDPFLLTNPSPSSLCERRATNQPGGEFGMGVSLDGQWGP